MRLCVVIPIHNEADNIGPVVFAVRQKQLDVVVVDDGSVDSGGEIARKNGAMVIHNEIRGGKGYSLKKGFEYALSQNYDGVIAMDGDGQHDPADLDNFLAKIKGDPNSVVTGNRMSNARVMPWLRLVTNNCMSGLISFVCRQRIPDTQCGYRYIGCTVLKNLPLTSSDYEIETEVLIKTSRLGYKIYSVPVQTIYRNEKSKISPFRDTYRFFRYLARELLTFKG